MTHWVLIGMAALALVSRAQTPDRPEFAVTSVKPGSDCTRNGPGRGGPGVSVAGRLEVNCTTLEQLIQRAYVGFADGVHLSRRELEVAGGPDWVRTARYDVEAKAEGAAHVAKMSGPMLRQLLEDRFKLKVHRDVKQAEIFAVTVAKTGSKLKSTRDGTCVAIDVDHWPPPPPAPGQAAAVRCGILRTPASGPETMKVEADGMTVADFFDGLSTLLLQQPVADRTGLTGLFDFRLEFSRDLGIDVGGGRKSGGSGNPAPRVEAAGPSLPAALENQLGLKIAREKGPVEFLVIDHAERPSAN